jgi:hypothetical protein
MLRKAAEEGDPEAQRQWLAHANTHWVASQFIFIDESSKDDRTIYRHYGRAPTTSRAVIPARFVRGDRFSVVAAMNVDGYLDTQVVEGSVDSELFIDFILERVVRIIVFADQMPISF